MSTISRVAPAFLIWQVLQEMVQGLEEELDYRAMQTAQVANTNSAMNRQVLITAPDEMSRAHRRAGVECQSSGECRARR